MTSNKEKAETHDVKVVHDYHDYANAAEKGEGSLEDLHHQQMEKRTQLSNTNRGERKFPVMNHGERNFPVMLHYMLDELEKDGFDDVVSWQPHGRCFLVHKQKQFVEQVLSLWLRQTKFSSFQRQLNLYGFKRLTSGRDKGGYYHELFLRSKPFLSRRIQRIKIKGTGARKPSSPETEPNFYNAPFLPSTCPPSKNTQVSMLASEPNIYADTIGSLSLQHLLAFPTYGASLQHQMQFAPPPLFRTSAGLLMEAQHQAQIQAQAQAQLQQQLRMAPLYYPEMHMVAGFGQHHIPMVPGPSSAASMVFAFSQQDQAALARSRSLYRF